MPLPLVSSPSTIISTLFFLSLLFQTYLSSHAARSPAPTPTVIPENSPLLPFFPYYYFSPPESPRAQRRMNWRTKIIIGTASGAMGIFMICLIIGCRKRISSIRKTKFHITNEQDIEVFLKDHGTLAQKKYTFSEVKKITKNFTVKLGEGGFGVVYKGELRNGYHVAVKILRASKGNGKDFINEVASISRTSHVNVVQLLGFCLEGKKKALIYEFMPNGSLDKFIGNKGLESTSSLSWDNLLQIAKGIARGLEYLHKG